MDMPARFRTIDRDTPMLPPADLREWVPANHIVHFILDAVAALPLASFHVNWRGSGTEQYPPAMMLALLIYCYATGRSSSRQIEAATYSDVAVRYNAQVAVDARMLIVGERVSDAPNDKRELPATVAAIEPAAAAAASDRVD